MSEHVMKIGGREYRAEVMELRSDRARVVVDGTEYAVDLVHLGQKRVAPPEATRPAHGAPPVPMNLATAPPPRPVPVAAGEGGITSPMPGLIFQVRVKEGETVHAGQTLLILEAMKMENAITSPYHGVVSKLYVREGDDVSEGDLLVDVARPQLTAL